jgi:hypothetical protein
MIFSTSTKTEFVPKWYNNQAEAKDDQIVIEHLTPTASLKDRLIPKAVLKWTFDAKGDASGGETEMTIDNKKIVTTMVTKIRNLVVEVDGKKIPVNDANDLYGQGMPVEISDLADEIGTYLQGLLSKSGANTKN